MELGCVLPFHSTTDEAASNVYRRMLEYAKTADRAGYSTIWIPEHSLIQFIPSPSSLLSATFIGQHVSCRVGTAAVVLPYHRPLQLFGEIAAVDHALEGRLDLGVVRGAYKFEFDKFGIDFSESLPRFIETLEALEAVWAAGDKGASYHGKFVDFDNVSVWPRPHQQPHPPVWIGAQTPPSVEDAAARGYNVMNSLFFGDEDHARLIVDKFFEGHRRNQTGADSKIGLTRYAFAVEDKSDVEPILEELLRTWRISNQLHHDTQNADARGVIASKPVPGEPTIEKIRETVLIGTREELLPKLSFYKQLGINSLNLNQSFGAVPVDMAIKSIGIFSDLLAEVEAGRTSI